YLPNIHGNPGDLPVVSLDQCDHLYPVRNKADTSRDSGDSEEKTRNTYKRHMRTRHGKLLTPDGRIIIMPEEEYATLRDQSKVSSVERRKQESLEKKEVRIAMALQQEVVEVCPDLVPVMKEEKKGSRKKRVNRRSRIRSTPVLPVNVSPKESSISSENVIFVQDPEGGFSFDGTQTIIMCDEVVEPVPAKTSQTRENAMQEYQLISVSEHMGDGETIILEGVDMNQLGDCYEIPVEVSFSGSI
ncbi:unnamed protein product, partial [Darwinula stevensoni]